MRNWSSICRSMRYANTQTEIEYQNSIKDLILENGLGWCDEQISEQPTLQLGSTERLIPDIVVTKDDSNKFVIEIKKPSHIRTQRNIEQLVSYMKQLEVPVGIYIGDEIEVYYKKMGDGSLPVLVLKISFDSNEVKGGDFVSLFSEDKFSVNSVLEYIKKQEYNKKFKSDVDRLMSEITSEKFQKDLCCALKKYLKEQGENEDVIETALSQVVFSISMPISESTKLEERVANNNTDINGSNDILQIKRNSGTVQRYAYGLIRQILEKNSALRFKQLYGLFGRKNFIEDITQVRDTRRWFMDESDIIKTIDGVRVVISNQWGLKNNSKPKMDKLKNIAKEQGIDV